MSALAAAAERRRRPLTREQLARLRDVLEPGATEVSARPLLGGIDTATYALRLGSKDRAREVVVRVYRDWDGEGDAATAALSPRPHRRFGRVAARTTADPRGSSR